MVLADTNIWIEHFRSSSPVLMQHLLSGDVVIHEFILGELSLAHFNKKEREMILERLNSLEVISTSSHSDVYDFSLNQKISGKGIGWIDTHLLHSCLTQEVQLLTLDKNLLSLYKNLSRKKS